MLRFAVLLTLASAMPLQAEEPNLSLQSEGADGAAARYVLAQRVYEAAVATGDVVLLVAAIRLGRSVSFRTPTSWVKTTAGEAVPDQPEGKGLAVEPSGPDAVEIARSFAAEDPGLQDLVFGIDAQRPQGRAETGTMAVSDLGGGQSDRWRMPLFGELTAEIALIGDGDAPLALTVSDEAGQIVCTHPPGIDPALCRFTPARNGFFTVEVRNGGSTINSYRLVGN